MWTVQHLNISSAMRRVVNSEEIPIVETPNEIFIGPEEGQESISRDAPQPSTSKNEYNDDVILTPHIVSHEEMHNHVRDYTQSRHV
ncbi:hypothetical protein AVEN_107364-1 [Araneus ventricosus]|uniref:Uncharacterized protein n=1 Tax=Araneus ventricosus TaxID=182803 RepID=A0A4Y2U2X8_ARAVE|nr:hypothetical protein AVEN_107364-1 [Araneus ventricosus]